MVIPRVSRLRADLLQTAHHKGHAEDSQGHPEAPTHKPDGRRLKQDHARHLATGHAQGGEDPDLLGALQGREQLAVEDTQTGEGGRQHDQDVEQREVPLDVGQVIGQDRLARSEVDPVWALVEIENGGLNDALIRIRGQTHGHLGHGLRVHAVVGLHVIVGDEPVHALVGVGVVAVGVAYGAHVKGLHHAVGARQMNRITHLVVEILGESTGEDHPLPLTQ